MLLIPGLDAYLDLMRAGLPHQFDDALVGKVIALATGFAAEAAAVADAVVANASDTDKVDIDSNMFVVQLRYAARFNPAGDAKNKSVFDALWNDVYCKAHLTPIGDASLDDFPDNKIGGRGDVSDAFRR